MAYKKTRRDLRSKAALRDAANEIKSCHTSEDVLLYGNTDTDGALCLLRISSHRRSDKPHIAPTLKKILPMRIPLLQSVSPALARHGLGAH